MRTSRGDFLSPDFSTQPHFCNQQSGILLLQNFSRPKIQTNVWREGSAREINITIQRPEISQFCAKATRITKLQDWNRYSSRVRNRRIFLFYCLEKLTLRYCSFIAVEVSNFIIIVVLLQEKTLHSVHYTLYITPAVTFRRSLTQRMT